MNHHARSIVNHQARTAGLLSAPPAAGPLDLASARITAETAVIRSIEPRADAQATGLLNHTSTLLAAGLALLAAGRLHGPAAWTAVGLLFGAVGLLFGALKPRLGGRFGFVRWAQISDARQLVTTLTAEPEPTSAAGCTEQARQMQWLSRSLRRKFRLVQAAQTLLILALTAGVIAAYTATR
jgi:hypothetical protein